MTVQYSDRAPHCTVPHYSAVLDSGVLSWTVQCCAVQWSAVCSADLVPGDEHCAVEAVAEARARAPGAAGGPFRLEPLKSFTQKTYRYGPTSHCAAPTALVTALHSVTALH